jgi:hypothetical protein
VHILKFVCAADPPCSLDERACGGPAVDWIKEIQGSNYGCVYEINEPHLEVVRWLGGRGCPHCAQRQPPCMQPPPQGFGWGLHSRGRPASHIS